MNNSAHPQVSIIINNYNYGRFVAEAVESALTQSYPRVEVIVIDDGSTDDSRARLAPYAGRVNLHFKENGGQASAFNAGLDLSHGDIIIFLDSDDCLASTIAQKVVDTFREGTNVSKVQYRLAQIDVNGEETGVLMPPSGKHASSGDLRARLMRHPDDLTWLPTSGNAFAATVLRRIFPVPEADYTICADYYLSNLSPLFGQVVALDEVGGYYRVHSRNNHHHAQPQALQSRLIIRRSQQTHQYLREAASGLGLGEPAFLSVTVTAHRLISLRLEPASHPFPRDSTSSLLIAGLRAAAGRIDVSLTQRAAYGLWFLAAALAPRRSVPRLASLFFEPESRPGLPSFIRHRALSAKRHRASSA